MDMEEEHIARGSGDARTWRRWRSRRSRIQAREDAKAGREESRLGVLRPCVAEDVTDKFLWSPRISHIWKNLP